MTDKKTHDNTLFKTGSWLQGRLVWLDLAYFKYCRFALIDENDGYFTSRLEKSANPATTAELREWRGRAIPLEGEQLYDLVGNLSREYIDTEVEAEFKRGQYEGTRSLNKKWLRIVGVLVANTDDYHLYIINLPREESGGHSSFECRDPVAIIYFLLTTKTN